MKTNRSRQAIVIGAGHNGLVAAFYLARAGVRTLVLERRPLVGGVAVTEEFAPGFKCSPVAHVAAPLRPEILRDMDLPRHGLRAAAPERQVRICALGGDGDALLLYEDARQTSAQLARFCARDADNYGKFHQVLGRLARIFHALAGMTPPAVDHPSAADLYRLLQTGRLLRRLDKNDLYRLLRWGPMPVADLMDEWFDTELLKAVIAARGIFGASLGPRSPGSSNLLLVRSGDDPHPAGPATLPSGGMGAFSETLAAAARAAGAEIRTCAEVSGITMKDGAVCGARLASGEEFPATTLVSNADPVRTLLGLVDPMNLAPNFLAHLRQYRCAGVAAKVHFALDGLPAFTALRRAGAIDGDGGQALYGRIHIGPAMDYLERAFDASKYGEFSPQPYLDVVIPSLMDPSLAPAGKHVMSVHVQFAPYKLRHDDWKRQADRLADVVTQTLAAYVPDLPSRILHRQVLTPADLEQVYGLTGGHIFHGELTLDQFFTMRPLLGWAQYRTPIRGLYLCGSGTHPGSGLTGACGMNAAREVLRDLK